MGETRLKFERQFVCEKPGCKRVTMLSDPRSADWLIAYRHARTNQPCRPERYMPEAREVWKGARLVVRCPQHITDWALWRAGYSRSKKTWRAVRQAQQKDVATPPLVVPYVANPNRLRSRRGRGAKNPPQQ